MTVPAVLTRELPSIEGQPSPTPSLRSLLPWLLAGGLIRIVLAPFTSHPYDMGAWISHQLRPFDAGLNPFFNWKYSAPMLAVLLLTYLPAHATVALLDVPQILAQQLWIKVPFIAADLLLAVVLGRCVLYATRSQSQARLASILWLFNPIAIFFTAVHGQVDALSAVLLLIAVLSLYKGSESTALASALGAGVAKYAGFVLVPFLAIRMYSRKPTSWPMILKTAGACVLVVALAFGPGLLVRGGLLGGLKSSLVTGHELSAWSFWGLLGRADAQRLSRGWLIVFVAWYIMLLWRFARSPDRLTDPLCLVRAATSALAMLIALDPVANPQFVLWVLPLALLLAFADRSILRLGFVVIIGLLNLMTLFTLLDPSVWFLNAIPNVGTDTGWLVRTYHPDMARVSGVAYAIALMTMAVVDAVKLRPTRRREPAVPTRWRLAARVAIAQGVVVGVAFVVVALQSGFMDRYDEAPTYPVDLEQLNSFPADHVDWTAGNLLAQWSDPVRSFAEDHTDHASVAVVAKSEFRPVVSITSAVSDVPVGEAGVVQHVVLPHIAQLLRIELLLGNPRFGTHPTSLPVVRLYPGSDPLRQAGVTASVDRDVAPGWFIVRIEPTELFTARSFTLALTAPDESGWTWNGAGAGERVGAPSARSPEGDIGARWIEAWALPRGSFASEGRVMLTPDNHLEQLVPLDADSSLASVFVDVPTLLSRASPLVTLRMDVRRSTNIPAPRLTSIGAASAVYLVLFALLTLVLTRRAGRRKHQTGIATADETATRGVTESHSQQEF